MLTPEIATVLAILALAIILFVTERIRVDIVALMVLVSLALTGLVTSTEALSGFANLAVITVWAVLILRLLCLGLSDNWDKPYGKALERDLGKRRALPPAPECKRAE